MSKDIGVVPECNFQRSEGDTKDIVLSLTEDGDAASTIGWTATIAISDEKNGDPVVGGTFTGTATVDGEIPIDMNGFNLLEGKYFYDIRIVDTVTGDNPGWVAVAGKFTVTARSSS